MVLIKCLLVQNKLTTTMSVYVSMIALEITAHASLGIFDRNGGTSGTGGTGGTSTIGGTGGMGRMGGKGRTSGTGGTDGIGGNRRDRLLHS